MSAVLAWALAWCLAHPLLAFAIWIVSFAWVADYLPENRSDSDHG